MSCSKTAILMNKLLHTEGSSLQGPSRGLVWRSNGFWLGLFGLFLFISLPFFIEKYIVNSLQRDLQRSAIQFTEKLVDQLEVERKGLQRPVTSIAQPELHFDTLSSGWFKGASDVLAVHLIDQNGKITKSIAKPGSIIFSDKDYAANWEVQNRISIANAVELGEATFSSLHKADDQPLVNLIIPTGGVIPFVYVLTLDSKQWLDSMASEDATEMKVEIIPFRSDAKEDYNRSYTNSLAWQGKWTLKFQSRDPLFALLQLLRPVFFALTWLIAALFFLYWRNFRLRQKAELDLQAKSQLLEKQNRLSILGEMSAQLAHEINQPLTSIANFAVAGKLQLQNTVSTATLTHLFQDILDQSHRAAQVLVTVRTILQPAPIEMSKVDVNQLIRNLEPSLRFLCEPHGVVLQVSCQDSMQVNISPILFEQVILNLVKNSVQSLAESDRPDKRISISSACSDGRVFIEHTDNGPGIDPLHTLKIFESFFTTKADGLGVGLSLCRSVIERFNGKLTLKSNSHRGACFLIDIPSAPAMSEALAQ